MPRAPRPGASTATAAVDKAAAAQETAVAAVGDLADEHAEATAERAGLAALPEYTAHADLVRRRDEVARADSHVATLDGHRTRARDRVVAAAASVTAARGQLDSDLAGVAEHLRAVVDAARAASAPGVVAQLPDPPAPVTEPRRDEVGETTVDVPADPDDDLTGDLELTTVADALRAPPHDRPRRCRARPRRPPCHRGRRREDPVVLAGDLEPARFAELRRHAGDEARRIEARTGLVVEAREEGFAALDVDGGCSDIAFPGSGTVAHAAVLLVSEL
jgi:hypothetical protein